VGALAFSILYYGGSEDPSLGSDIPEQKKDGYKTSSSAADPKASETGFPSVIPMADRPKVILFTGTSWCPACVQLQRNVLATSEWRKFSASEIRFQVYNVPRSSSQQTKAMRDGMKKYNIQAFPTMVVVSKEGKKLATIQGAKSSTKAYRDVIANYFGR
ncbi:MAG: thioredoxin family protein, partial [Verrucomicrobiota bacterium]